MKQTITRVGNVTLTECLFDSGNVRISAEIPGLIEGEGAIIIGVVTGGLRKKWLVRILKGKCPVASLYDKGVAIGCLVATAEKYAQRLEGEK
jgi:hypothetical protein